MSLPSGMRAVVTGAAGGLGRAFCAEIRERRGRLLVSDVNLAAAEETADDIRRHGGEAYVAQCDVADFEQVKALADRAEADLGGVDLLINNAGVAVSGVIDEVPLQDLEWVMNINLWGVIYGCRAFLPMMKRARSGYILNVASAAGLLNPPELGPYNITKAGVVALSETLRGELRGSGISVTVLCPTFFKTGIVEASRGIVDQRQREFIIKLMHRSRVQAPDVARAALDALGRGQLYAVPMVDGRLFWWFKRAMPERFDGLVALLQRLIQRN